MLKRLTAVLLMLALLLGCAVSCERKEKTAEIISGTYKYNLSFDELADFWVSSENELSDLIHEYADFTWADFEAYITLDENGKYERFADYDSFLNAYRKVFSDFYEFAFTDSRAATDIFALRTDNSFELDNLLELQSLDTDDFLAANEFLFEDEDTIKTACDNMVKCFADTGKYTFTDNRIYLSYDKTEYLELDKLTSAEDKSPTTPIETKAEHSELYNEKYTVDEVCEYFAEVVLTAEYSDDEYSGKVQKWLLPIYYHIEGDCTEKDKKVLGEFTDTLNSVTGFPGIYPATDNRKASMAIGFFDGNKLMTEMGEVVGGEASDGIAQYWYILDSSVIYAAQIGYDNGVSQSVRSSVIVEEIMNSIGFSNDTSLRDDSVIYEGFTNVYELSDMDLILLSLLYHPSMKSGMTKDECFAVIEKLYY